MDYLQISGLDKRAARIALGTAWITPDRKDAAFQVLDAYYKAGGNFIDTARIYGDYTSEDILSEWLGRHSADREKLIIQTKGCHHEKNTDTEYPDHRRVSPAHIESDLTESLHHLGLTYVDIYLLHRDDPSVPVGPLMDELEKHRRAGRIKVYGVSNWTYERIAEANAYCKSHDYQGITVNSPAFSLAPASIPAFPTTVYLTRPQLLRFTDMPNLTTVCWSSQAQGFFTRTPEQMKDLTPETQQAYVTPENRERRRRAEELSKKYTCGCTTATTVALSWVLSQPLPVCAIIGPSSIEHLNSSLAALKISLTPSEQAWLNLETPTLS